MWFSQIRSRCFSRCYPLTVLEARCREIHQLRDCCAKDRLRRFSRRRGWRVRELGHRNSPSAYSPPGRLASVRMPLVLGNEARRGDEHAARTARGVKDAPVVGLDDFGEEADDAAGGVKLIRAGPRAHPSGNRTARKAMGSVPNYRQLQLRPSACLSARPLRIHVVDGWYHVMSRGKVQLGASKEGPRLSGTIHVGADQG